MYGRNIYNRKFRGFFSITGNLWTDFMIDNLPRHNLALQWLHNKFKVADAREVNTIKEKPASVPVVVKKKPFYPATDKIACNGSVLSIDHVLI